mmetsp:Transcript_816/g.1791  ORF Transcript_816/g.1791 Transcript_816/m.1791 type:complete len:448 (+) Transcript_816:119-1462(+)
MRDASPSNNPLLHTFDRPCGDDLRSLLQAMWSRLESWPPCSSHSNAQEAQESHLCVNKATDVVRVDWSRIRDERSVLLEQLDTRLREEGLALHDLPEASDQELLALFAELGFESMLERTKLLKGIKELGKMSAPRIDHPGVPMQLAPSVPVHFQSESSSDFVPSPGPYFSGEVVEYYSRSLGTWLPSQIFVESRGPGQDPLLFAHILVDGSQRHDVCLELLRLPLKEGEPCEVFSPRLWRWLEAVVVRSPHAHPGLAGQKLGGAYCVSLLEDCGGEAYVPASRLRRRFPEGSPVSVYRGLPTGWIDAVVTSSLGRSDLQPGSTSCADPPSPRPSEEVDVQQFLPAPVLPDGATLDFWTDILVSVEGSPRISGGETLQVSSCFLRHRTMHEAFDPFHRPPENCPEAVAAGANDGTGVLCQAESFASVISEVVEKTAVAQPSNNLHQCS